MSVRRDLVPGIPKWPAVGTRVFASYVSGEGKVLRLSTIALPQYFEVMSSAHPAFLLHIYICVCVCVCIKCVCRGYILREIVF